MDAEAKILPFSHKSRRGSETRQKTRLIGLRVTEEYYAELEAAAGELTVPSYVRETYLPKKAGVRSRRRPLADVAALSEVYTQLFRIGNNLNQIARALNSGDRRELAAVTTMQDGVERATNLIALALGYGK